MFDCTNARPLVNFTGVDINGIQPYVFKPDNPFMDDLESYSKAKRLFRDGVLSEAVYALEAEVSIALAALLMMCQQEDAVAGRSL